MANKSLFDEIIDDSEALSEKEKKKQERNRRQRKILNHNLKLKNIKPLTDNQDKAFHAYFNGQNLLMYGTAGTGKTYIAMYLALNDVLKGLFDRVIVVRSAVASRDMGFLPGTLAEKLAMFEVPYREMIQDLCQAGNAYDLLKTKDSFEFISTSYLRGITLDNAIIVIDEVQNMTMHEIDSILTRVGENSKVIVCGDFNQNDLSIGYKKQQSGMDDMVDILRKMKSFELIEFNIEDIVRSGFVREYLLAKYLNEI